MEVVGGGKAYPGATDLLQPSWRSSMLIFTLLTGKSSEVI